MQLANDRSRTIAATILAGLGFILFIVGRSVSQLPLIFTGKLLQQGLLDSLGVATWIWIPICLGAVAYLAFLWCPAASVRDFQQRYWFLPSATLFLTGLYVLFSGLLMDFLAYIVLLVLTAVAVLTLSSLPAISLRGRSKFPRPLWTAFIDITFGLLAGWSVYLLVASTAGPLTHISHSWFMRNFFGLLMVLVYGVVLLAGGRLVGNRVSYYVATLWPLLFMVLADLFVVGGSILVGLIALVVLVISVVVIFTWSQKTPLKI